MLPWQGVGRMMQRVVEVNASTRSPRSGTFTSVALEFLERFRCKFTLLDEAAVNINLWAANLSTTSPIPLHTWCIKTIMRERSRYTQYGVVASTSRELFDKYDELVASRFEGDYDDALRLCTRYWRDQMAFIVRSHCMYTHLTSIVCMYRE